MLRHPLLKYLLHDLTILLYKSKGLFHPFFVTKIKQRARVDFFLENLLKNPEYLLPEFAALFPKFLAQHLSLVHRIMVFGLYLGQVLIKVK